MYIYFHYLEVLYNKLNIFAFYMNLYINLLKYHFLFQYNFVYHLNKNFVRNLYFYYN